ncbi:MAG: proteobacterial dedicated sortase system histidine kinase [Gammaproteobacteria bacterium]|nr:proteobacterial dedicated sortase system histidine kinase [Gammaproteobacteria bacterium]
MRRFSLPSPRLSIRAKLLLVSTSLLIIPWVGTHYVQEMEDYLRQQQEEILLTRTQTVASVLQDRPDVFKIQTSSPLPTRDVQHLFVRPLHNPIQLDGYLDDWSSYSQRMQHYDQRHALFGNEKSAVAFDLHVGSYQKYLYVAMKVYDRHIVYRRPESERLDQSDRIIISVENPDGEFMSYLMTPISPGWINAQQQIKTSVDEDESIHYEPEIRIKGEWREFNGGYVVEFRIPIELIGAKMSLAVADVNDPQQRGIDSIVATAGIADAAALATIIFPSPEVEALLNNLQRPLTRTWVIDRHNRVIAQTGALTNNDSEEYDQTPNHQTKPERSIVSRIVSWFYTLVLKQPTNEFHDELLNASRLDSEEFRLALQGKPTTRWRKTPNQEISILTAAHPVYNNGQVIGAVAIEQTSNSILLLQNRALEILFNISALAFLVGVSILLLFATRLSFRVRRLRDAAEQAITSDGRVVGDIATTHAQDEVGDLSRSIADMLARLAQYNRYLETMASKLSHELRTPITVVRSSLDNLEIETLDDSTRTYVERAREGANRLNDILTRMSEATRLEQTLQSEQPHSFDLVAVVKSCIDGYRLAHPHISFSFDVTGQDTRHFSVVGAPELIAQMLDKLVNNAIDFHSPGTPITTQVTHQDNNLVLRIMNNGPTLPAAMKTSVFDSMVSVRGPRDEHPHLGLGLYIVRLIVEFHRGKVQADDLTDDSGVVFTITLPPHPSQN